MLLANFFVGQIFSTLPCLINITYGYIYLTVAPRMPNLDGCSLHSQTSLAKQSSLLLVSTILAIFSNESSTLTTSETLSS